MKRTKMIAYIFNLYSMSAVAGYECHLKLTHLEDSAKVVSEKVIRIEKNQTKSGNVGILFVESKFKKRMTSIHMNAVMSGWEGEEDVHFVLMRKFKKREKIKSETISQTMSVKGSSAGTWMFDYYRLDMSCDVKDFSNHSRDQVSETESLQSF